ncbi:hypothetical protein BUL40_08850 [Croceivirga radicis]|uniref:DUF4350 domain-containing protein n=1 Tax=Croceivirga radicis TaxID=1929488 RepID=A0A1V6LRF4_9FLAO|nr:DUF4350 domain-containing protein [Croceivirga radicis]OQD42627.1 hypothetical protein BUL40_08850 [Croceivirga radicis]
MDKRSKIILGVFCAVLLAIIVTEITKPRPINWRPSYTQYDKIPFGCYVLFQELESLFPKTDITSVDQNVYEFLVNRDSTQKSNYLLINDHISLDRQETNQLLKYVSSGNSVLISTTSLSYFLMDTLNIKLSTDYTIKEDTLKASFTNTKFSKKYVYDRGLYNTHFSSIDTLNATVLGHISFQSNKGILDGPTQTEKHPNFIKSKFGEGQFYINTIPQAFSNYYLLNGNEEYAANALSYLNDEPLFWDSYKKAGRVIIDSPMRFVLNQTALKWAYYLTIAGLLLFVIFKAKREQRIIPVITAKENTSVAFARTVGSLYYQNKDYTDLIDKKIKFFLAYLRRNYYIDTTRLDEGTIKKLAAKSGKTVQETKALVELIQRLKGKKINGPEPLLELNKKITAFKK